ncbi:MAG: DNA methyltransferase [Polyangiaceae bacterium]
MNRRRSLTNIGGATFTSGDPATAAKLAEALDVRPAPAVPSRAPPSPELASPAEGSDDADRAHVHGFHTYPARMHPRTAARLVTAVSAPGTTVLDPFCGSGTVLVEAMVAGRRAIGIDLNPLAVRLARLKTTPFEARDREVLVVSAREIAAFADARRVRRAGSTRRYPPEDVAIFDPHVLLELDSLRSAISDRALTQPGLHLALELLLSAILVKVSRQSSDTSEGSAPRRLAAGFTARLFARKAEELAGRLAELAALMDPNVPPARIELDDACRLKTVAASTIDAIVTSPPYVATYDYLAHHALRMRWLALDARAFSISEMGSRRRYGRLDPKAAREAWAHELGTALRAMSRACRRGGRIALVLADSAVEGVALRADAAVASASDAAGLVVIARASQERPHFHGPTALAFRDRPRAEHAIVLEKR